MTRKSSNKHNAVHTRPSRAKYTCKPELQKLFDWVNLVPSDLDLKSIEELIGEERLVYRIGTPQAKEYQLRKAKALITYLKTLPQELLVSTFTLENLQALHDAYQESNKLVEQAHNPETKALRDKLESMLIQAFQIEERRYWRLRTTRKTLYRLAEIGENAESYYGRKLEDVVIGAPLSFMEYAYLDENGIIRRSPNPFAETLEGVEVSRIRACLICRKLFWANRKDKRCCSEEHSRIIRQRQVRENQRINKDIYGAW
jgi:hypothetical protein